MNTQFFVIGGEYRDMRFTDLVNGTSRIEGPYRTYEEAEQVWKSHAMESRSNACTRSCSPHTANQHAFRKMGMAGKRQSNAWV